MFRFLVIFSFLVSILACTQSNNTDQDLSPKALGLAPILSKSEAELRFKQVKDVKYNLSFMLDKVSNHFSGTSEISFTFKKLGEPLRVDFFSGKVKDLKVNGKNLEIKYNDHYLSIGESALKDGKNILTINFEAQYSRDGAGLYRFVDKQDNETYLYTDLQPFDANKVFPCFDQPDLKATYKMSVVAPKDWKVVTSVYETKKVENSKDKTFTWTFPESAKFSTYIWSLHAGPYAVWTDTKYKIPLRLFARKSLKEYIKVEDWFVPTRQGFEFFNTYFDYEYPYLKYDQLIVPDFNAGAMENVAAVTFSESYTSRGQKTRYLRRRLASVILHEMAHMWFGDLVTAKWWDDLWLNESFATYMAAHALYEATEFKESWRAFQGTKQWAYWEDQLVTTHPIEAEVPDTQQAFANFDGITYGKGASVLKQIAFYIGPDNFKKGTQSYFKKYAEKNTTLEDFMNELSLASGMDLKDWQKMWLQKPGVNTVSAVYSCEGGKINKFSILQKAHKDYPYNRIHKLKIALMSHQGSGHLKLNKSIPVTINGERTQVKEAHGELCPDLVYPNHQDYAYLKVRMDKKSVGTLISSIDKVNDPFLRQLYWLSLWQMVRDAELNLIEFSDLLISKGLKIETETFIVEDLLKIVHGRYDNSPSVLYYLSKLPKQRFTAKASEIEDVIWQRLKSADAKSEIQKVLFKSFVDSVSTQSGAKKLQSLLESKTQIKGLKIDQDKRWEMIKVVAALGYEKSKDMIATELEVDKSSFGKSQSIAANAIQPNWENKKKWIEEFKKEKPDYSFSELKSAIYNIFPRGQDDLRSRFAKDFYGDLKKVVSEKDTHVSKVFVSLAPASCNAEDSVKRLEFIEQNKKNLNPVVLKELRVTKQENDRCNKIISMAK